MSLIPYGRHQVDEEDIAAVIQVLRSDVITQGPTIAAFEATVAQYTGAKYAIAVNSATSALHIACLALGLGRGDRVWTSPITFVASANCAIYCGAEIDFVDIDPATYNICAVRLRDKLVVAKKEGKLPKVVIPVHMTGQPCDMAALDVLRHEFGFSIIEDASHALGARFEDEAVGNCRHSDITVFSFHPVKIITSGEGGMALTNDEELAKFLIRLRSHGITSDPQSMEQRPNDELWNYQQISLGFNYRMSDINAALGISQMRRLDSFLANRRLLAARYDELLKPFPVKTPWQLPHTSSSYHLYVVRLSLKIIRKSLPEIYNALYAKGVLVNLHYIPVYLQPFYSQLGFERGYCPEAERYFKEALTIPLYPSLSVETQDNVLKILGEVLLGR